MKAIVTDDSRATRLILKKILEELKFEVELMEDGGELLNTLTEETPDLCLIDWNMPGMNGTEVIRAMQNHPDWCDIPAILVTDEKLQPLGIRLGRSSLGLNEVGERRHALRLVASPG